MTTLTVDRDLSVNKSDQNNSITSKSWIAMLEDSDSSESMASNIEIKVKEAEPDEIHEEFLKVGKNLNLSDIINPERSFEIEEAKKTREIKIDFLDEENEKKFDRLVSEDKIKSPFKRRFSTDRDEKNDLVASNEMEYKKTKFDSLRERTSSSSSAGSSNNSKPSTEYETDPAILDRRQKQIDYGKNTIGYENYLAKVPIDKRTKEHPKTPPKQIKFSRRAWDGLVKNWRKKLHCWDPSGSGEAASDMKDSSD